MGYLGLVGSGSRRFGGMGPASSLHPCLTVIVASWQGKVGAARYGTNMARDCATDTIADTAFAFDMETGGKT